MSKSSVISTASSRSAAVEMPIEAYHQHPAVGSTDLKLIGQSPAHFKYAKANPRKATPSMILGSAAHDALLQPDLFKSQYVVELDLPRRSNDDKAKHAEFAEFHKGKKIITQDQMDAVEGMLKAVYSNPTAKKLLNVGHAEKSYFTEDPEFGVQCKSRPDFLREGKIIIDLKTTEDASLNEFSKTIHNFQYHISAAWYLDVVSQVTGDKYDTFILLAVENKAPHGVAIYYLSPEAIERGRTLARQSLGIYASCLETGVWPSYDEHIQTISLPPWSFK